MAGGNFHRSGMNRLSSILCLSLAVAVCAAPLRAQDAPKADVPAPAPAHADPTRPDLAAKPDQDSVVLDEGTEADIGAALKYLAARQAPNGSWSIDGGKGQPVAMTAYTLIAFLATGNLPNEGPFGKTVANGAQYLMDAERPDGLLNGGQAQQVMYGHGIGTIALAELYGQTKDPKVKAKLEAAVRLIINCQNKAGGWRYEPRIMDADISVTVLQVVALRAAKNSGIDVPQETVDRAVAFVKSCASKDGGFSYQPGSGSGFARTAAAIYSLQVCGLYDDPLVKGGSQYLIRTQKQGGGQYFTYGNFYAAPAQYMIGGDTWKQWYSQMSGILRPKLKREGELAYWEPLDGGQGVGRVYATAVYTTILALPYHYLPLYQR